jgi:hypothetical protein
MKARKMYYVIIWKLFTICMEIRSMQAFAVKFIFCVGVRREIFGVRTTSPSFGYEIFTMAVKN